MNKITFIQELEKGLKKIGVRDSIDIIKDYETHFDNELSKGKSEEEIAKELGSIPDILADFQSEEKPVILKHQSNLASLVINDFFGYLGLFCLYMLNLALISTAVTSLVLGFYLMISLDIFSFIPILLSPFSIMTGLTVIIFSVFSFGLSIELFKLLNGMTKRLNMWNHEVIKGENKEYIKEKPCKLIRRITKISGITLIFFMIISYIVGVLMTSDAQFWHYWNWFS